MAMCEWVSMMPGIATRPAASITAIPCGAWISGPTAATLPSCTRIDPLAIVPLVTVRMVASLIRTLPPVWILGLRLASNSVAMSTNWLLGGWSSGIVGGIGAPVVAGVGAGLAGVEGVGAVVGWAGLAPGLGAGCASAGLPSWARAVAWGGSAGLGSSGRARFSTAPAFPGGPGRG